MVKMNQTDHVLEDTEGRAEPVTVKLSIPGIKTLHQKPTTDVAAVLANVLRSQPNIIEVRYKIGEYIAITTLPMIP